MYDFVSLHNHSDKGSVLDGYAKPIKYIEKAAELGQPAVGISDHGTLYGVNNLITSAKDHGIGAVPGIEFYVAPENPKGAKHIGQIFYGEKGARNPEYDVSGSGAYLHLTAWAYNNVGLHNLFKLSTMSFEPQHYYQKQRIDFNMLAEHSEGLIVSTGCPSSEISTRLLMGQQTEAYNYARRLKEVFGENLYVEIMEHNMDIDLERKLLPMQMKLARELNIELLATNDCHYTEQHEHVGHEEMLCAQSGSVMSDKTYEQGGRRFAFNGQDYYMKTSAQMNELFPEYNFPNAIKNTLVIAEKAQDVTLEFNDALKPTPVIPPEFDTEYEYYMHLLTKGFHERYGNHSREDQDEIWAKIQEETEVIYSSDFIGYMLVVADYLNHTREKYATRDQLGNILASPLGPGRGSVGGSISAFVLYISDIEPVQHSLIFARFLGKGRGVTYRIEYSDGTIEDRIASDDKLVNGEKKYIHQLNVGDEVEESQIKDSEF